MGYDYALNFSYCLFSQNSTPIEIYVLNCLHYIAVRDEEYIARSTVFLKALDELDVLCGIRKQFDKNRPPLRG
jgi:hypothetical protein